MDLFEGNPLLRVVASKLLYHHRHRHPKSLTILLFQVLDIALDFVNCSAFRDAAAGLQVDELYGVKDGIA